jgi:hypothetical protein
MNPRTVDIPPELLERAEVKARRENLSVDEVLRKLLSLWVVDDPGLLVRESSRKALAAQARASQGIWQDRDPDQFLAASRSGLDDRDEELKSARLDVR